MNILYPFKFIFEQFKIITNERKELQETRNLHMNHTTDWYENIINDWNHANFYKITKITDTKYSISPTEKHSEKKSFSFLLDRDLSDIGGIHWSEVGGIKKTWIYNDPFNMYLSWNSEAELTNLEKVFIQYLEKWSQ